MPADRTRAVFFPELLESRRLLATINVADFGGVVNDGRDDTASIAAAIRAGGPGDIVSFPVGTLNMSSVITIGNGDRLQGQKGSKIVMSLTSDIYGFAISGDASNVTIDGLDLNSNRGILKMTAGSAYNNISITNNLMSNGGGKYGIFGTITNNNLKIEHNYFHDSQDQLRVMEVWRMNHSSYSYNAFYNVEDVGHIMDPGPNVRFSYNWARLVHRMGIEVQDSGFRTRPDRANFIAEGNVMYDWFQPYWDSMCMSIPITSPRGGSVIIKNYLRQNALNGEWIPHNNQTRGSYGIELGMESVGRCEGNIVGGEKMVNHIVVMENDIPVANNKLYGRPGWGAFIVGEPNSHGGWGSFIDINNLKDNNFANMPSPESIDWAVLTMKNAGPGGGWLAPTDPPGGPNPPGDPTDPG
ncbi:MAG: hypothetical protein ACREJC_13430, partial [Tepidisphaeraceae bacterium]